jgi:tRNA threonylcarbamoyladenosine biosynthesis protein TsaE
VFARGVGLGWGAIPSVTSPTFTLVHEHTREADSIRLYHADSYRLSAPDEALTFGLDELLADSNPLMIEWPERVADLLPADRLWITFDFEEDDRRMMLFEASGESYEALLEAYRKRTFGG